MPHTLNAIDSSGGLWHSTDDGATWLSIPAAPGLVTPSMLWFLDDQAGFVVGSIGPGFTYNVHSTLNGGVAWVSTPTVASNTLVDVVFLTPLIGFAAGDSDFLKTIDGGVTWNPLVLPVDPDIHIYRIRFFDADNFMFLPTSATPKRPYITHDGGVTWTFCSLPGVGTDSIPAAAAIDANTWLVGTSGGIVYKTTDGGTTWVPISTILGTPAIQELVIFEGGLIGWICAAGTIYGTIDGGVTWTPAYTYPTMAVLVSITFVDALNGWAGGIDPLAVPNKGLLLTTADGGVTWTPSLPFVDGISRIQPFGGGAPVPTHTPPDAIAAALPTSGDIPLSVAFTGSGVAYDGETIVGYEWDFGDGSPHDFTQNPSYIYSIANTYIATLTVTDSLAATGNDTVSIQATAPPVPGEVTLDMQYDFSYYINPKDPAQEKKDAYAARTCKQINLEKLFNNLPGFFDHNLNGTRDYFIAPGSDVDNDSMPTYLVKSYMSDVALHLCSRFFPELGEDLSKLPQDLRDIATVFWTANPDITGEDYGMEVNLADALAQLNLGTAEGPWLDHWGAFFLSSGRLGAENDLSLRLRIADSLNQPKNTIEIVKSTIAHLIGDDFRIYELAYTGIHDSTTFGIDEFGVVLPSGGGSIPVVYLDAAEGDVHTRFAPEMVFNTLGATDIRNNRNWTVSESHFDIANFDVASFNVSGIAFFITIPEVYGDKSALFTAGTKFTTQGATNPTNNRNSLTPLTPYFTVNNALYIFGLGTRIEVNETVVNEFATNAVLTWGRTQLLVKEETFTETGSGATIRPLSPGDPPPLPFSADFAHGTPKDYVRRQARIVVEVDAPIPPDRGLWMSIPDNVSPTLESEESFIVDQTGLVPGAVERAESYIIDPFFFSRYGVTLRDVAKSVNHIKPAGVRVYFKVGGSYIII